MSTEQNFLIIYGLHNFVTHALKKGKHVFFIRAKAGRNMICHAKTLIKESFGETTDIHVV